jgi:aryl-alcohol dehydrogenase-like predicted oxidoreductase
LLPTQPLGRTGLDITTIGFGAWGIGSKHYGEVDADAAIEALAAYIDGGGNFIDTARGYHHSERVIGKFLKDRGLRDRVVISSKIWGNDEATIRKDLETSLSELQIDCLDLYHLHDPPSDPDEMNAALDVMDALKKEGKIKGIAASLKGGNVTSDTQDVCRQYIQTGRLDAIQLIFSVLRQDNRAVFDEAADANVSIIARTCLENGFLTGKYEPGHRFPEGFPNGDHRSRWNGEKLDRIIAEVDTLKQNAVKPPYESMAQVALRYVYEESGVTTMIPGAKNRRQSEANIRIAEMPALPDDLRQHLTQAGQGKTPLMNLD